MSDFIELKLVTEGEAECLHRLQAESFMPSYEKYQDDDTSPAKESLERITEKINEENSDFYFIVFHGEKVGGNEWRLDTIKQETGNCHLYEKCGFVRVGEEIVVNEKMTLVHYMKKLRRYHYK